MNDSLRHQTAQATRWSAITEVAVRLILPFVNVILARLLTPEAFGVVATVTMIVSFAELFADAGFQKYIIQHKFKDKVELNQTTTVAFWTNLSISVLLWLIVIIFSSKLAILVGNSGLEHVIIVSSASLPLQAFSSIQISRFKRNMDFKSLFYIRILTAFIPLLVTVPLAYFTHSYWALIIGTLATNIINACVLSIRSKWKPNFYYSFSQLKEMFSYSWWILLESISTWLTSYLDTFLVSVYLSTYYIGLYKTSMVTVNQIMGLIVAVTSGPLFVALTKVKDNKDQLKLTYDGYMHAIALFIFPLSAGIWVYRDLVTNILLGSQWGEAVNFIGLWGLMSSIALVLGTNANGLYNAVGKTKISFGVSAINLIIMIPVLNWAAAKGFEYLYICRSLLRLTFVIIQLFALKFVLKYSVRNLLRGLFLPMLATLIMVGVAYLLKTLGHTLVWELVSILICVIIYFCIYLVFFKKVLRDAFMTLGIPVKFIRIR